MKRHNEIIAYLEDPVRGLFISKSADGRIWKKVITEGPRPKKIWKLWEGNPIELALTGQTKELEMVQELMSK